jgi:hypothetical protein
MFTRFLPGSNSKYCALALEKQHKSIQSSGKTNSHFILSNKLNSILIYNGS